MNATKSRINPTTGTGADLSALLRSIMAAQPVSTPERRVQITKVTLVPIEPENPETAQALALLDWSLYRRSARITPTITARKAIADRPIPSNPPVERVSLSALYHVLWGRLDGAAMPSLAAGDTVPLSALAAGVFIYRERGDFAAPKRINSKDSDQKYIVAIRTLEAFLIRVANETGRTVILENETVRLES